MTQSVSFRITRTAEDVAQMLNALSQRLVKLEQRMESLELQMRQQRSEMETMPEEERQRLDDVDQLLKDCHSTLQWQVKTGKSLYSTVLIMDIRAILLAQRYLGHNFLVHEY